MKNKWHDIIRNRLKENRKECLACLYPEVGYTWGNVKRTLTLINELLKDISVEAWPSKDWEENDTACDYIIASNNWRIKLGWEDGKRSADLKFRNDDHTAWVIERSKKYDGCFIAYDIGGS